MSIIGHDPIRDEQDVPPGWIWTSQHATAVRRWWEPHVHDDAHELLWGVRGSVTAETEHGFFALPINLGLWIPAGVEHAVSSGAGTRFSCTYLDAATIAGPGERTQPVELAPAVRELLRHLHENALDQPVRTRAEQVVVDLLKPSPLPALTLPMPADARLERVTHALLARPEDPRSIDEWARELAVSPRHLSRLFQHETGMPFTQWRMHARARAAIALLAAGEPVGLVARRVGYRTPSAFVHAFGQVTGHTPGEFTGRGD